jgi:hypothetical protein
MDNSNTFESLRIKKISINGTDIELSFITSIDIYESLSQPGITGFIAIQDYQGLRELGNVFSGDILEISFGVDGQEEFDIETKFVIYTDEGSRVLPQQMYDVLNLGFCSIWLRDALSKSISKPYKDKYIHEIIEDILITECSGANIGYIEPTLQKLEHFLSPRWTPFHIIKHLLSFALNKDKIGGYICWTDLKTNKINVTTLDYLVKGNLGKANNSFIILPGNKRYQGRIKNLTFESSFDSFRMVTTGIHDSVYYGFNFDKNEFITTKDKITDLKNSKLSNKFPFESNYASNKKYSTYKFCPIFPSTDTTISSDDTKLTDLLEGALYTEIHWKNKLEEQAAKIEKSLHNDPDFVKSYEDSKKKAAAKGETFVPMKDREIVALIAYLQRLGTDIKVKNTK